MFNRVLSTFALGLTIGLFTLPSAPAFAKTIAECDSAYEANKAAIKASGQTKKDYVARAERCPRDRRRQDREGMRRRICGEQGGHQGLRPDQEGLCGRLRGGNRF